MPVSSISAHRGQLAGYRMPSQIERFFPDKRKNTIAARKPAKTGKPKAIKYIISTPPNIFH